MQETWVHSLGWEDPLEKGKATLQYSGLEDCIDCTVHGVTKSWPPLSDFHFTSLLGCNQDKSKAIWQEAQAILGSIEMA